MPGAVIGTYRVAGLLLSASAVRYAGQLIMLLFIARFRGADAVGSYTVALAICAPVYILAGFGVRVVYLTLQHPVGRRTYERFLSVSLLGALAAIGIISIVLPPPIAHVLLIVATLRIGEVYWELYSAMLQRAGKPGSLVAVTICGSGLQVVASGSVFLAGGSLVQALGASCAVYLLNLVIITRSRAVAAVRRAGPAISAEPRPWVHLFRAGLPTGISIGMITLLSTVPQYLLALGGAVAAAGQFAVFLYVVVAVEMLLHALSQSWIPQARELWAAGRLGIGAVTRVYGRWLLIAGSLGLLGLMLAAMILPAVLGPHFAVSVQVAAPLSVAVILVPAVFATNTAIVVHNRYAMSMLVSISALVSGTVAGLTLVALDRFNLIAALWTFVATMLVRAAGGFLAMLGLTSRDRRAPVDWAPLRRYWVLAPVFVATTGVVAAGPHWSVGVIGAIIGLGLLVHARLGAAELLVITAPVAFYVTLGGVLINLAVSDVFLLILLVRVLTDAQFSQALAGARDHVRTALYVLAFLFVLTSSTLITRSVLGGQADWVAFAADGLKLAVVFAYFIVCFVVFRARLIQGDWGFLRIWARTAAGVGALGVAGSLAFTAGHETDLAFEFRATSTFEDPNAFATYLILSIPIAMMARLLARKSVVSWHLIPMLAGVYFSFSRGALVGLAAVLGVLLLTSLRQRELRQVRVAAAVAAVIALIVVVDGGAGNVFESSRGVNFGDDVRFQLWAAASSVWLHSPIFGVGLGQFITVSEELLGSAGGVLVHNTFLSVLAETGVIGTALYLAVPGMAIMGLLRRRDAVSMLLLASAVGVGAMALSLNLQNMRMIWMLLAIALAWITSHRRPDEPHAQADEPHEQAAADRTARQRSELRRPRARAASINNSNRDGSWNYRKR